MTSRSLGVALVLVLAFPGCRVVLNGDHAEAPFARGAPTAAPAPSAPSAPLAAETPEKTAKPVVALDLASASALAREIQPLVAKLRGVEYRHDVEVGLKTRAEFTEAVKKESAEETPQAEQDDDEDTRILLGLLPPGADLLDSMMDLVGESVAGYYDYREAKKFFVIEGHPRGLLAEITIAHELCHALEDQVFDLAKLQEKGKVDADHATAITAVIEGSATTLMNLFAVARVMRPGKQPPEMPADMGEFGALAPDTPPALAAELIFNYLHGSAFMTRNPMGMGKPRLSDWNRAFNDPPTSTEQILHPAKYWDASRRDDPRPVALPDLSASLGDGFTLARENVLGEARLALVISDDLAELEPHRAPPLGTLLGAFFSDAAAGWGGDRAQLYRGKDGARLLVLAIRWDTENDRDEFDDAFGEGAAKRIPFFRATKNATIGGDAATVLVFADDAAAGVAGEAAEAAVAACAK